MPAWPEAPASYWRATARAPEYPATDPTGQFDCAIVGAGYTGLNAALTLAEAGMSVALIDAAEPGWGASGRAGGFCCLGGDHLGLEALARRYGEAEASHYAHTQLAAIMRVSQNLQHYHIEADRTGDGERVLAHKPQALAQLAREQASLRHFHGLDCPLLSPAQLRQQGLANDAHWGGLAVPAGFGPPPLKYPHGLARAALAAGVTLFNHQPVTGLERRRQWLVTGPRGLAVSADQLLLATNGYSPETLHPALAGRILAAQSNILVTRPLTDAELAAQGWTDTTPCYDTRNLLYYFRLLPDKRLLFGGRAGIRQDEASFAARQQQHEADFRRYFPAWRDVEIDYFWRGNVALSRRLHPHVARLTPGLFCALAYHGNGIAMGSHCGRQAARLMLGKLPALPDFMLRPPARFPLPGLRPLYLAAAYLAYRWQDR